MNQRIINETLKSFEKPKFGYTKVEEYSNLFSINGEMVEIKKSFGIIYSVDEEYDTLHKHGDFEKVKEIFHSKYEKIDLFDCRLLEVPIEDYLWINTIINISASNWIKRLVAHLNTFDVEII